MARKYSFCRIAASILFFVKSCVSVDAVAFHCGFPISIHALGSVRAECRRPFSSINAGFHGPAHLYADFSHFTRRRSWVPPAMCKDRCHPDDDPNSGSVLPVKDRIALYSQVSFDRFSKDVTGLVKSNLGHWCRYLPRRLSVPLWKPSKRAAAGTTKGSKHCTCTPTLTAW